MVVKAFRKAEWGRIASVVSAASIFLSGCSVSREEFYENRYTVSDTALCRTMGQVTDSEDVVFRQDVINEAARRGLSAARCEQMITDQNAAIAIGVLGAIAIGAAAASNSGGGGGGYSSPTDYDWAWDQFQGQNGGLVWACRGRQTGQFAEQYRCASDVRSDYSWPGW